MACAADAARHTMHRHPAHRPLVRSPGAEVAVVECKNGRRRVDAAGAPRVVRACLSVLVVAVAGPGVAGVHGDAAADFQRVAERLPPDPLVPLVPGKEEAGTGRVQKMQTDRQAVGRVYRMQTRRRHGGRRAAHWSVEQGACLSVCLSACPSVRPSHTPLQPQPGSAHDTLRISCGCLHGGLSVCQVRDSWPLATPAAGSHVPLAAVQAAAAPSPQCAAAASAAAPSVQASHGERQIDGRKDGRTPKHTDGHPNGQAASGAGGQTDGRVDGRLKQGRKNGRTDRAWIRTDVPCAGSWMDGFTQL
jgi:hypothetical protein